MSRVAPEPPGAREAAGSTQGWFPFDPAARQRVAAYGILTDSTGRVLLVRAARHLTVAGRWFLPGGGIEHGETPSDALRREIGEETGLEVETSSLLGVLSDTSRLPDGVLLHTIRLVYRVHRWRGSVRSELAGSSDEAAWFDPSSLEDAPVLGYVRTALERFGT